jgi:hypothetical protein
MEFLGQKEKDVEKVINRRVDEMMHPDNLIIEEIGKDGIRITTK